MPEYVRDALLERGLMEAYHSRPPYQQNDYIGWVTRAKCQETRERRLAQMLEELESSEKYVKMDYRPRRH
jgi:hypothetical protein